MNADRCPWTVRWGTTDEATTRCDKPDRHDADLKHEGPGLMPGQRVAWFATDRREYTGEWPGYCQKTAPLAPFLNGGCTLPEGHRGRCAP